MNGAGCQRKFEAHNMINIKGLLNNWRRQRNAIRIAVQYFESNGGRKVIRSMCSIIAAETERCVVQVCYGDTRPPGSIFYAVYDFPQQEVTELPFEEVAIAYGVKPWR
jgi:hypothetical protein